MQKAYRRYELLLPTRFNSGDSVPGELFADTLLELEDRFGAVSSETQLIEGRWRHQGVLYRDESVRVFCDVPDTADNRQFFTEFKERLKTRFQQIEMDDHLSSGSDLAAAGEACEAERCQSNERRGCRLGDADKEILKLAEMA